MASSSGVAAPNVDIILDGTEVKDHDFISYIVERDINQPDVASVILANQNDIYTPKCKIGGTLEIKVGTDSKQVYVGEILGVEPIYRGGETTKILIRSINKMHRLIRKRKSMTFTDKNDQQILDQVVKDAGLTLEWKHDTNITYKHVYQHNLNGLEFVRQRAARLGAHVWCVDKTLHVKEPDLGQKSGVKLSVDKDGNLRSFMPRMNSSSVLNKVTVKGWDPEKKELITGEATAQNSPLGGKNAVAACSTIGGNEETFTCDHPIWSKQEADALAKARLRDLNLQFITGEAECAGNADLELGKSVEIEANAREGNDPFNGDYYVMGITHRHTLPKGKDGGFVTILKLARDAQKA
ncbi:MAG: phage late control D family protein [Deltaproteobacteria bacterium]|nr:phage late control D family protein [Deltaproteobacteria bacterium]